MKVSLVFVTRNEVEGLKRTFDKVPRHLMHEAIAIDGHSTDGTVNFFRDHGIPVFAQREKGLGAAMLEARERITGDALIYFHPDGNEDPGDLPKFIERLEAGAEFVVASRMVRGAWNEEDSGLWRPRKWANLGLAAMANVLFSHGEARTTDITNGFRAITCNAFDRMCLTSRDLTMDFQMVIRALKLGMRIDEFPTHEGERFVGTTGFPSFQTGMMELGLIWRELAAGDSVFESARLGERSVR